MYRKVLVPVDGSPASMRGLDEALKLAKKTGAEVRLIHVVDEFVLSSAYAPVANISDIFASLKKAGEALLAKAEGHANEAGVQVKTLLVEAIGGRAADQIVQAAREFAADLIVMGTHGRRGIRRIVMGSDAELVVRNADIPVMLVRAPE